jgi:apolipoprotein D and lipocalin family protein
MKKLILLIAILFTGCVEKPKNVNPIEDFELSLYLGTWYEIARLDHRFERGMEQITATYSMREDGGVKVINKGYKIKDKEWKDAEGKAYFVESPNLGYLKVSFFGPFYGAYIIFDLDYDKYALISGPDHSYFWILSRKPQLDEETLTRLIAKAKNAGFDTKNLIFVKQNK